MSALHNVSALFLSMFGDFIVCIETGQTKTRADTWVRPYDYRFILLQLNVVNLQKTENMVNSSLLSS